MGRRLCIYVVVMVLMVPTVFAQMMGPPASNASASPTAAPTLYVRQPTDSFQTFASLPLSSDVFGVLNLASLPPGWSHHDININTNSWRVNSGGTPTPGTGPIRGHSATVVDGTDQYLYAESTGSSAGDTASVEVCFDVSDTLVSRASLVFYYSLGWGADASGYNPSYYHGLHVYQGLQQIFYEQSMTSLEATLDNGWLPGVVSVTISPGSTAGACFQFEAVSCGTSLCDIAIDDVSLITEEFDQTLTCSPSAGAATLTCERCRDWCRTGAQCPGDCTSSAYVATSLPGPLALLRYCPPDVAYRSCTCTVDAEGLEAFAFKQYDAVERSCNVYQPPFFPAPSRVEGLVIGIIIAVLLYKEGIQMYSAVVASFIFGFFFWGSAYFSIAFSLHAGDNMAIWLGLFPPGYAYYQYVPYGTLIGLPTTLSSLLLFGIARVLVTRYAIYTPVSAGNELAQVPQPSAPLVVGDFCGRCSAPNFPGNSFCTSCGLPQPQKPKCHECTYPFQSASQVFCGKCGARAMANDFSQDFI